jgi:hypothetical protein
MSPPSAPLAFFTFMTLLAPVTNCEPCDVTLAGYSYAMRHGMNVQFVTPYRVSHLQRYGFTVHGNVKSVYPPLNTVMPLYPLIQCVRSLFSVVYHRPEKNF